MTYWRRSNCFREWASTAPSGRSPKLLHEFGASGPRSSSPSPPTISIRTIMCHRLSPEFITTSRNHLLYYQQYRWLSSSNSICAMLKSIWIFDLFFVTLKMLKCKKFALKNPRYFEKNNGLIPRINSSSSPCHSNVHHPDKNAIKTTNPGITCSQSLHKI